MNPEDKMNPAKTLQLLCLGLLLTAFAGAASAQQHVVGTGTATATSTAPIYRSSASSSFDYSRYVILYNATDLAGIPGGSIINDIEFYLATGDTAAGATGVLNVYMRNTTATNYTASFTWDTSGATLVYSNNAQTITAPNGFMSFGTFSQTFTYTGDGIEVLVDWDISAVSGNPTTDGFSWQYTARSGSSSDSQVAGAGGSSVVTSMSITSSANYNRLPNARFSYTSNPGTAISVNPAGGSVDQGVALSDHVVMDLNASTFVNPYDLESMTVTRTGTVGDAEFTNVALWRDENDNGVVDSGTDTPLGSGTLSGGTITFSGTPLQALSTAAPTRLLVAVDTTANLAPAETFEFSIVAATDVTWSGGTDYTIYPVDGGSTTVLDPNVPSLIYYKMNEGAGTTTANDAIPGVGTNPANIGPAIAPNWVTPGHLGAAALDFSTGSGSGIETGWTSGLSAGEDWTIEMWLRLDQDSSGYPFRFQGSSFRFWYSTSSGLQLLSTGGTPSTTIFVTTPALGVWQHVAISYDSTAQEMIVYVDGVVDSVNPRTASASGELVVGSYSSTSTRWYGALDEFRVWNKVRSQAEIQALMQLELPPVVSTLLGQNTTSGGHVLPATNDNVMMDLTAAALILDNDLNSVTFTKTGTINNNDVVSVRLYRDDNDNGVVDGSDTLIDTDVISVSDTVTFSGSPLVDLSTAAPTRLLLAIDIAGTAAVGDTISFSVDSASDVSWTGGTDQTNYPLVGGQFMIYGAADSFPYHLGFETNLPYFNATQKNEPGAYPTIQTVGGPPGPGGAPVYGNYQVSAGPVGTANGGSMPRSGNGMFEMYGASNIGASAIDLLFDFSGINPSDTVELEFWWADQGLDVNSVTDPMIGVFLSTDGGANWHMGVHQIPTNQTEGIWYQEIINLSAMMSAASLSFTNQTMIRFQMAENLTSDQLVLDDIRVDIVPESLRVRDDMGADTSALAGGAAAWVYSFELAAYGATQTPNAITIQNIGTVASTEVINLTLWEDTDNDGVLSVGDTQVGAVVPTMTGDLATFSGGFTPLNAGESKLFFVSAEATASAATLSTIQFEIEFDTDVSATPGPVSGIFPIQGSVVTVVPLPLSGTYSINQTSGDFTDIGDAFDVLELAGIGGPVILEITDSATYISTPAYSLGMDNAQPVPNLTPVPGASATNTITLRAAVGQTPVIQGSATGAILYGQTTTTGLTGRGGLVINQSFVTVEALEVTGGPDFGIMMQGNSSYGLNTSDITIRRCIVHGIPDGPGIAFMGQNSGYFANGVIENNFVWDCFTTTAPPTTSSVLLINTPGAITVRNPQSGSSTVRHNTVLHTSTFTNSGGIGTSASSSSFALAQCDNNIVICTDPAVPAFFAQSTTLLPASAGCDYNFWFAQTQSNQSTVSTFATWQGSGRDTNGSNADPRLISTTGTIDLRLAADSPCINPPGNPSTVPDDIDGTARPLGTTNDIGAFEADFPQIRVFEGLIEIFNNSGRNIGGVDTTTGATITFTIENAGSQDLILTGSPDAVAITLGNNMDVSTNVSSQPASTTISAGTTQTFDVYILPSTAGAFDLTLDIDTNHPVVTTFTFDVTGVGFIPNDPAQANPSATSVFVGGVNGPFTLAVDPGTVLADAEIELTDPDNDNITVTAINPPATAPTGITPPAIPAPGHPILLEWTGTADATNAPGSYTWQVSFQDAGIGTPVTVDVTITINDLPPIHSIANAIGGDGSGANPYTAEYTETIDGSTSVDLANVGDPNIGQALNLGTVTPGGANPAGGVGFDFSLAGGLLTVAPAGTLDANDVGTHSFDVDIEDGTNTTTISVSIDVNPAPVITTTSPLPNGEQGQAYATVTIAATGGTGALSFSVTGGALPPGMNLAANGDLTGTPTTAGNYNFTVTVADSLGAEGNQAFDITIDPPALGLPNITTTTLPDATEGSSYGPVAIQVTGGTVPYTFAVTAGNLPAGLSLGATGEISGTPTVVGSETFDITVTDAAFASDTVTLTLTVNAPSSGGGGGSDSGGGCVANTNTSGLWVLLLGALGLLAVVTRVRASRD
jgi:hypothetical protein